MDGGGTFVQVQSPHHLGVCILKLDYRLQIGNMNWTSKIDVRGNYSVQEKRKLKDYL